MKDYKTLFWVVLVSLIIFLTFAAFFVIYKQRSSEAYNSFIKSQNKLFCYETYSGPANPVQFVKEEKDIDSLKDYYDKLAHGNLTATFNFPISFVPVNQKVVILSYKKDSTIAKIRFYYKNKREYGMTGYVYASTLHKDSAMTRRNLH